MPASIDILNEISDTRKITSDCIARCRRLPVPTEEKLKRIRAIEDTIADVNSRIEACRATAVETQSKALEEQEVVQRDLNQNYTEKVHLVQVTAQETNSLVAAANIHRKESQEKVRTLTQDLKTLHRSGRETSKETEQKKHEKQEAEQEFAHALEKSTQLTDRLREIEQERQALQESLQNDRARQSENVKVAKRALAAARLEWDESEAGTEIIEILSTYRDILNRAGSLEDELSREIGIVERAETSAGEQGTKFADAMTFHRTQAWIMLGLMLLVLAASIAVVLLLFIFHPKEVLGIEVLPPSQNDLVYATFSGVGRVAILFFLGWALRFVGVLHRSHAEQTVLYRDRTAALDVANNLLRSSPNLEQRQALLQIMAEGYLTFEKNAFRTQKVISTDKDIRHPFDEVSKIADALTPMLASLTSLTKAVNKPEPDMIKGDPPP